MSKVGVIYYDKNHEIVNAFCMEGYDNAVKLSEEQVKELELIDSYVIIEPTWNPIALKLICYYESLLMKQSEEFQNIIKDNKNDDN